MTLYTWSSVPCQGNVLKRYKVIVVLARNAIVARITGTSTSTAFDVAAASTPQHLPQRHRLRDTLRVSVSARTHEHPPH